MPNETTPEYEIRRDGADSSEYKLAKNTSIGMIVLVPAISYLNSHFELGIDPMVIASALLAIGGAVYGYAKSRGEVKASRNNSSGTVEAAKAARTINAGEVNITPKPEDADGLNAAFGAADSSEGIFS